MNKNTNEYISVISANTDKAPSNVKYFFAVLHLGWLFLSHEYTTGYQIRLRDKQIHFACHECHEFDIAILSIQAPIAMSRCSRTTLHTVHNSRAIESNGQTFTHVYSRSFTNTQWHAAILIFQGVRSIKL